MPRASQVFGPRHAQLVVMPDRTLRYRYAVPGVGRCEFSTLSEVGEPWVAGFRVLIDKAGLRVEPGVYLNAGPWVADKVVGDAS